MFQNLCIICGVFPVVKVNLLLYLITRFNNVVARSQAPEAFGL